MFGIGMQELAVIFVVALLIFGPKRLPELARTLGKGLAEFRRASNDLRQSFNLEMDTKPRTPVEDPRTTREPVGQPDQLASVEPAEVDDAGHGDLANDEPDPDRPTETQLAADSDTDPNGPPRA